MVKTGLANRNSYLSTTSQRKKLLHAATVIRLKRPTSFRKTNMSTEETPNNESEVTPESAPVESAADAAAESTDGTSGGPSTATEFLEALREVIDPELMINIVDLGLIYSVETDEENPRKVNVDMTLTSPACPAGPQLVNQSKMALERLHDVDEAAITMVMSPPWSPERMTDDARDQLGIF